LIVKNNKTRTINNEIDTIQTLSHRILQTLPKVSFACDASFKQVATIMPGIVTQGKMEDDDLSNN